MNSNKTKSVGILNYAIRSSQGDLQSTLESIEDETTKISSKEIPSAMGDFKAPYFLFENEVKDNQDSIYEALKEIVAQVLKDLDTAQRRSTTIIIGTSIIDWYSIDAIEDTLYNNKEYISKKQSIDSYARELSNEFGLNDFTMTINTACTSSANAMLEASNLLNADLYRYVVVVGLEVFSQIMSRGFCSMQLLSSSSQKPFDKERDGIVLGEAMAAVLLSKESSIWSLEGGANSSDSINITATSEDGSELREVMKLALKNTNLSSKDIRALKAHATSTNINDLAEINAISQVFNKDIAISCLKPYLGHTLGACGVLELLVFMSCIDKGFIPKVPHFSNPITDEYRAIKEHKECDDGVFMLNYFGFGGNNTSLIIKKEMI